MRGIIEYRDEDLVSTQLINSTASVVFQATATPVLHLPDGRTAVKYGVMWYDNETQFSTRATDHMMTKARVMEDIETGRRILPKDWKPAPAKEKKKKSKKGGAAAGAAPEVLNPGPVLVMPKRNTSAPKRRVAINGDMNDATRAIFRQIIFDHRDAELVAITGVPGLDVPDAPDAAAK